ncbi:MAG TPA: hypothetical protein VGO86_18610, partial [Candidatus Dormibacteraeota bacterium]
MSLVEAVVASALMGIGVVGGLTAWDTASVSAGRAVRDAWASCIVRAELDAILSAKYASPNAAGGSPYNVPPEFAADGTVRVTVVPPSTARGGRGTPGEDGEGSGDEVDQAQQEAEQDLERLAQDHAGEISKMEQALANGTSDEEMKALRDEAKRHAEAIREAV